MLGTQSVSVLRDHASGFIIDEWRSQDQQHFVDIGTGAGVPGILLAIALPESRWTLIDASQRRCRIVERVVEEVKLRDRVRVEHARAGQLSRSRANRESFDGATSRLFGPVSELAECGLPLLRMKAKMVVSVSKKTESEWRGADLLKTVGCRVASSWTTPHGYFLAIQRVFHAPAKIPRRTAARRRSPLF